ncbi:MAG: SH3 domain-containing protein, partial [Luteimonas sp.]
ATALTLALPAAVARSPIAPASSVFGVTDAELAPEAWISRLKTADAVMLDRVAIDARNVRLMQVDDSMHDLQALPAMLDRATVNGWIQGLSQRPTRTLYDESGQVVAASAIDAIVANVNLDAIPASQPTRYGMVVQRAALRGMPTSLRVFSSNDNTDIDRFQESAMFPGTPVAIVHASQDRHWLFVVSPRYAAWVEARFVAEGKADAVFAHAGKAPYRVVTGAKVRTVYTREQPQL